MRKKENIKARGVYIGGAEVACGNDPSYFADLAAASNTLMQHLRTGSQTNTSTVHGNYCIPYLTLSGTVYTTPNKQPQVSGYIESTQFINDGIFVNYKAGTYIQLNPGFVSGNNFLAEIDPCVRIVTIIAAKREETEVEEKGANPIVDSERSKDWLKVYPTIVEAGNALNVESSTSLNGLELMLFDIQGRHTRSYRFNGFGDATKTTIPTTDLPTGIYILKAQNNTHSFTQKIIIQ